MKHTLYCVPPQKQNIKFAINGDFFEITFGDAQNEMRTITVTTAMARKIVAEVGGLLEEDAKQ